MAALERDGARRCERAVPGVGDLGRAPAHDHRPGSDGLPRRAPARARRRLSATRCACASRWASSSRATGTEGAAHAPRAGRGMEARSATPTILVCPTMRAPAPPRWANARATIGGKSYALHTGVTNFTRPSTSRGCRPSRCRGRSRRTACPSASSSSARVATTGGALRRRGSRRCHPGRDATGSQHARRRPLGERAHLRASSTR
jgi:hypothetical protein